MGDEHQAMSYVSEVLDWINQHGLAGIEFPVQVHLACYQVLDAQSTRAPWLKERALHALGLGYELVQTHANGITDP